MKIRAGKPERAILEEALQEVSSSPPRLLTKEQTKSLLT